MNSHKHFTSSQKKYFNHHIYIYINKINIEKVLYYNLNFRNEYISFRLLAHVIQLTNINTFKKFSQQDK